MQAHAWQCCSMTFRNLTFVFFLLGFFWVNPLAAEDTVPRLGSFAPPSWQTVANPKAQSRQDILRVESEGQRQIIYEMIPRRQTQENWRKRHWVYVAENVAKSVSSVRNSFLNREKDDCVPDMKWADWGKSRREIVFAVFCGERKSDGLGYVAAIWLTKSGSTVYRVSEEWRGPAYEFGNEATYFWERTALTDLIAAIGASELE